MSYLFDLNALPARPDNRETGRIKLFHTSTMTFPHCYPTVLAWMAEERMRARTRRSLRRGCAR
jgi:hypothetical protein